jgi:Domain of unknown function (DUF4249)
MVLKRSGVKSRLRFTLPVAAIVLLATNQCVEPYTPQPLLIPYSYLVVEGFLIDGEDPTVIKLTRTRTLASTQPQVAVERDAIVRIEEEQGNSVTLNNNNDGTYSASSLSLNTSKNYRLTINTEDGKEYASDFVPVKKSPAIDNLTWKEEVDGIQVSLSTRDPENKTTYYLWSYEETWQYNSAGYSVYKFVNGQIVEREFANELQTCWKQKRSNNIYLTSTARSSEDVVHNYKLHFVPQESRMLLHGYSLLVKQHAISRDAFDYWTNLKENNESLGTLFDRMPTRDLGNIRCTSHPEDPVLGFFSATSLGKKRIVILRQEILGPHLGYDSSEYIDCKVKIIPLKEISEARLKGLLLINREYDLVTQELIGYSTSTEFCIDCRLNGGTNVKPDYWR